MSLAVSKDCFPDTSKCHNCDRKKTKVFTASDPKENSKRCSNCHLMTYCDRDCQKEHWLKVHKQHCRFLSGKTLVKNSNHDPTTCAQCIQERETSRTQLVSENSPKTRCNNEVINEVLKKTLSSAFKFHGEGKKCSCSLEYGLQLPFVLGEVSGQYWETAGTGLDALLAHALKIIDAMMIKAKDDEHRNALSKVWTCLMSERAQMWYDILICGKRTTTSASTNNLYEQVDSLLTIFGASNPWWKILRFSVSIVKNTIVWYGSNFEDSHSLDDPRFSKFKLMHDYQQSQLKNQAIVCERRLWPKFMLWPQPMNGSLTVLLPPGTLCQSCNAKLSGEFALSLEEFKDKTLPILFPKVSDNGALVACCPIALKPTCLRYFLSQCVQYQMDSNEDKWKEYKKQQKIFLTESRDCDFCLKWSLSSHRCSGCLTVQYCSTDCQKEDKDFHNTVCANWAKDESRKIQGRAKQKQHWKKDLKNKK